ncbi:MAG: organic solvent tolerance protein OstA, partial [Planctomycetota bacterium]
LIGGEFQQANEAPLEVYLEGNIVFRQGDRTVYAERMYYDVRRRAGVVLNAELFTPLPESDEIDYRGLVRLKAGVLRQLDDSRFVAEDGLVTTSRLEEPSYSFRSDTISFEDLRQPIIDPLTGQPAIDPSTGLPRYTRQQLARSRGNTVEVGGVPIFRWPTIATDLEEPTYYIDDLRIRNDSIFGAQVLVDLDVYQLLGIEPYDGTEWTVGLDVLTDRGLGHGTRFEYGVDSFAGLQGRAVGEVDFFGINDTGIDNLGFGRRTIAPEASYRGRAFWNHRQKVAGGFLDGWIVQAEVGWISDRTFLEQYYEAEWDQAKDQTTGVRLKRLRDSRSLSIEANGRVNDFFTETEWLPRLDHYVLGQDVFGGGFTWYGHTSLGYAELGVADAPFAPSTLFDQFNLFPWEQDPTTGDPIDARGERLVTRHEIDYPINLAPFKVVPYALGEVGTWGSDLEGNDLQRAYGQFGVRASLPMWRVNPNVRDPLFNLNGLAHKIVFDAELSYADANENYDQLPLYDELEDNSLEELRRRFFEPGFGGPLQPTFYDNTGAVNSIDAKFDPRFYAIRSGIQGVVSAPTFELAEDQIVARLGMRHRLQTKRGAPGQQRIVDWLIFDANAAYFPDADRDNLG